jgi:hypothetical protein
MGMRERGLRRVAAVTTGLAAASVAGSLAIAAVAHADTAAHRATVSGSTGTGTGQSGSDVTGNSGFSGGFGGQVSGTDRAPRATSGGS